MANIIKPLENKDYFNLREFKVACHLVFISKKCQLPQRLLDNLINYLGRNNPNNNNSQNNQMNQNMNNNAFNTNDFSSKSSNLTEFFQNNNNNNNSNLNNSNFRI